ncbi:MAG: transcriptional regulator NrdR [Bdellovibrionaceae bacterium]|nr:transcriptional regulator NrdR [Pseudobdellovibrionaceae bacterium]
MNCPFCEHDNDRVLDTRVQKDGSIRRRRQCLNCKSRFSTIETILIAYPMVIKKDGRREAFSREKILAGLRAACQKRPISEDKLDEIVTRVSTWILNRGESETPTQIIGQKVMSELRKLDDVAYVRFASVYRTFKDVQEFVDCLEMEAFSPVDDQGPQLRLKPFVEGDGRL